MSSAKRVLASIIGRYGGAFSDLDFILDLVAREMARKYTAFYNAGYSVAPSSAGMETLLLTSLSEHGSACHFGQVQSLPWPLTQACVPLF